MKNIQNHTALAVLLAAGVLSATLLAGCSSKPAASSEVASSSEAVSSEAASSEAASSEAASNEEIAGGVLYLTGTVKDASMNGFTLVMDDGTEVPIMKADDTEIQLADGLAEGAEVSVFGVTEDGGETMTASLIADLEPTAADSALTLVGTVTDASMNSFNLTLDDGTVVPVVMDDSTTTSLVNGLGEGGTVVVIGMQSDDSDTVTAISIADSDVVLPDAAGSQPYTGTLANCAMHSFQLVTADGTMDFITNDSTQVIMANGMGEGASVVVVGYSDNNGGYIALTISDAT